MTKYDDNCLIVLYNKNQIVTSQISDLGNLVARNSACHGRHLRKRETKSIVQVAASEHHTNKETDRQTHRHGNKKYFQIVTKN